MPRNRLFHTSLLVIFLTLTVHGKEDPQVIVWPQIGSPVVRFSFGKFKEVGSRGQQRNYTTDTTVQSLWEGRIARATFSLYLYDKNKARIGEGWIVVSNLAPGQVVKFQTGVEAQGTPVSLEIVAQELPAELQPKGPPKTVSITVNSVPQGANFTVDGNAAGTTPKVIHVTRGQHVLEFSKEGFNPGKFPFELGADDVSGGSVSYELGVSAHDTVELRDGSVLTCDVESVSAIEVVIRVSGNLQHLDRNKVKRIALVERDPPTK